MTLFPSSIGSELTTTLFSFISFMVLSKGNLFLIISSRLHSGTIFDDLFPFAFAADIPTIFSDAGLNVIISSSSFASTIPLGLNSIMAFMKLDCWFSFLIAAAISFASVMASEIAFSPG